MPDVSPVNSANSTVPKSAPLSTMRDALLIATLAIWGLHSGADFLIPLALAFLMFILITAIADWLRKQGRMGRALPGWLASLTAVLVVLGGFLAILYVFASQATQFARAIPEYEAKLDATVARFLGKLGMDATPHIREQFVNIDMSQLALSAVGSAGSFLSVFMLICIYVGFMLGERLQFARKFALSGLERKLDTDIKRMMNAVSLSLRRYIGVKSFISFITATFSYVVFRALGLDFPETWAVLTFALNFIPSIGSVIAVICPALVALVQFDTIGPFLLILLGCGLVQFFIGNFLDPALTGRSLNLSTLMVILALTFWTALWGLIGAFISVPMTVCVVILFSHVPALRPLAILMSLDGTLDELE